jgi:hypothetical protein
VKAWRAVVIDSQAAHGGRDRLMFSDDFAVSDGVVLDVKVCGSVEPDLSQIHAQARLELMD